MTLGIRLRALRKAKGLSLRQVRDGSGVSASTLSRAERDLDWPDTATLLRLESFYEVALGSGLNGSESSDAQVDTFLVGHGIHLEQIRAQMNALIDMLRDEARAILARRGDA